MALYKVGDWIQIMDANKFVSMHDQNCSILSKIGTQKWKILNIDDDDGAVTVIENSSGKREAYKLYKSEIITCFKILSGEPTYGSFKIILTYVEESRTIEEEGVTYIKVEPSTVEYSFNRKKLGFLKYKGEVKLGLDELKQITISTPDSERVLHIENGVIIREHVMYDDERKFKFIMVK